MTEHLTPADLEAFRSRKLNRDRIEQIGAHVRTCSECAKLVFSDDGVATSVDDLWTPQTRPRRRFLWPAAAALAIVAAGAGFWFTRDDPQRPPVRPPRPEPQTRLIARQVRDGAAAIVVDANGAVLDVSTTRLEWNRLVASALTSGVPPTAPRSDLIGRGEVLRGDGDDPAPVKLIEPLGVILETDRPRFRWTAAAGAQYRVIVARDENAIAKSEPRSSPAWTLDVPLRRGETYAWQVLVTRDEREWTVPSPDEPPALFRILSASERRELEDARATRSRLVTGIVAGKLGLEKLAARELRAFAAEHPWFTAAARLAAYYDRPAPTTTNADQ